MRHENSEALSVRGSRRWPRGFVTVRLILVAIGILVVPSGTATAQQVLRWQFKPGETVRFSIEQKMLVLSKAMGVERRSNRTSTLDVAWKVLSVSPEGEAEINQRTERLRMKADEPPLVPFAFDSDSKKAPQPGFEALTDALKAEVGAEFTFKMKPNGEITDITLPEETVKKLRESAPEGAPADFSEKALKETLRQASPPAFPNTPLDIGSTWSTQPARMPLSLPGPNPPVATLVLDRKFHYQGPNPTSPETSLVRIDTHAKVVPIEGIDIKVAIRKQDGSGSMTVDTRAGRMTSTRLGLNLELLITGKGQTIEYSSESTSSMTLRP